MSNKRGEHYIDRATADSWARYQKQQAGSKPVGLKSDYRDERWASRIHYLRNHAGEWILIGFFCLIALALVVLSIILLVDLWTAGLGWISMILVAIPVVIIGWNLVLKWSDKTLEKARRRRLEDGDGC